MKSILLVALLAIAGACDSREQELHKKIDILESSNELLRGAIDDHELAQLACRLAMDEMTKTGAFSED